MKIKISKTEWEKMGRKADIAACKKRTCKECNKDFWWDITKDRDVCLKCKPEPVVHDPNLISSTAKIKSIKVTKRAGKYDDMGDNLDDIDDGNNDPMSDDFAPNFGGEEKLDPKLMKMINQKTRGLPNVDESEVEQVGKVIGQPKVKNTSDMAVDEDVAMNDERIAKAEKIRQDLADLIDSLKGTSPIL